MAATTPGAGSAPGDRSKAPISGRPANSRSILDNSIACRGTLALWDAACWTFATAVVLGVRLDFTVSDIQWRSTLRYLVISMVALVAFGYLTKFYRGRCRVGSFDEVTGLAGQFAIVGVATALLFTLVDPVLPRSIPVLVPPIALVSAAAGRWLFRTYRDRNAPTHQGPVKRALVYDAGYPGSVVVTSLMTFAATTNAITYCGARPVVVDSDESGNVDPALVERAVADQLAQGADVSAIMPVDLLGKVADHAAILAIAAAHDIPPIVDAAESLGATRDGRPAGSAGVCSIVSFNDNKIMRTSGGGALLTDDGDFAQRIRYLATQARQGVAHYEHSEIGYNYRMSNLLAGLGRAQLVRLPEMIERRRQWRRRYRDLFADVAGVELFGASDGVGDPINHDNFWLTSIIVDSEVTGSSTEDLRVHLEGLQIESRPLRKPMHLQPVFAQLPAYTNGTSERLFRTGLSLPSGSALSDEQSERVTDAILKCVNAAAA